MSPEVREFWISHLEIGLQLTLRLGTLSKEDKEFMLAIRIMLGGLDTNSGVLVTCQEEEKEKEDPNA